MRRDATAAAVLLLPALLLAACDAARDLDFEFADTPLQEGEPRGAGAGAGRGEGRGGRYIHDSGAAAAAGCGAGCGAGTRCVSRRGRAVCVSAPRRRQRRPGGKGARCVGCGEGGGGGTGGGTERFLCGTDNRTYSSLCRLDLHNCVRGMRGEGVRPACRGVCPCPPAADNEVLPPAPAPACPPPALASLAARLRDWVGVLHRAGPPSRAAPAAAGFPPACPADVRWMFSHLDADGDGALSHAELYALRHDERERCLRPFLASCGRGGAVTRAGWCGCLAGGAPCARLLAAHPPAPGTGAYVPACDALGYFLPRQCDAAARRCWCVDPRGAELPAAGAACSAPSDGRGAATAAAGAGVPADDEDAGGSGYAELAY